MHASDLGVNKEGEKGEKGRERKREGINDTNSGNTTSAFQSFGLLPRSDLYGYTPSFLASLNMSQFNKFSTDLKLSDKDFLHFKKVRTQTKKKIANIRNPKKKKKKTTMEEFKKSLNTKNEEMVKMNNALQTENRRLRKLIFSIHRKIAREFPKVCTHIQ